MVHMHLTWYKDWAGYELCSIILLEAKGGRGFLKPLSVDSAASTVESKVGKVKWFFLKTKRINKVKAAAWTVLENHSKIGILKSSLKLPSKSE